MKPKSHSKLSDARLKALLKGLRADVVAPPDFSARVLKSLRAEGLLPALPETAQEREPWWERFGAQLWARPRWGLALAAGLVLGLTWVLGSHPERPSCAPAPAFEAPQTALSSSAPALASAVSSHAASATGHVLAAHRVRHSFSTELAYSSTNGPAGQAASHSGATSLSSSAPALGQGSSSSGVGTLATQSGLVTTASRLSAASPAGSTGGGNATFSSYRSSAVSPLDKAPATLTPTPVLTATPQHATPVTTLGPGQNSQVRNNVILASRGQSAQIIYHVAQSGQVLVAVYSRLGRKVAVLQNGNLTPGWHNLSWNGQSDGGLAASGIYEVLIETPTYTDLHKMMLVK